MKFNEDLENFSSKNQHLQSEIVELKENLEVSTELCSVKNENAELTMKVEQLTEQVVNLTEVRARLRNIVKELTIERKDTVIMKNSWSRMPDELIAEIVGHLKSNFDIINLMETNKKIYKAIKHYKKYKMRFYTIIFTNKSWNSVQLEAIESDFEKKMYFRRWNKIEDNVDKLEQVLDNCFSVEELRFDDGIFKDDIFHVLMNTKANIGRLFLKWNAYFTVEEKLRLGQKLCVEFEFNDDDPAKFSDEFLSKLLPVSTFSNMAENVIGTVNIPMPITDKTLDALISENMIQKRFFIQNVHNSMTIKKLVEVFKIIHKKFEEDDGSLFRLRWYLGTLHPNQAADAKRYFGVNGELNPEYIETYVEQKTNTIAYYVSFIVCKRVGRFAKRAFSVREVFWRAMMSE